LSTRSVVVVVVVVDVVYYVTAVERVRRCTTTVDRQLLHRPAVSQPHERRADSREFNCFSVCSRPLSSSSSLWSSSLW